MVVCRPSSRGLFHKMQIKYYYYCSKCRSFRPPWCCSNTHTQWTRGDIITGYSLATAWRWWNDQRPEGGSYWCILWWRFYWFSNCWHWKLCVQTFYRSLWTKKSDIFIVDLEFVCACHKSSLQTAGYHWYFLHQWAQTEWLAKRKTYRIWIRWFPVHTPSTTFTQWSDPQTKTLISLH